MEIFKDYKGFLLLLGVLVCFVACEETGHEPENDLSYLEKTADKLPEINPADEPPEQLFLMSDDQLKFDCSKVNSEIVGVFNKIEYFGAPGYGATPARDEIKQGYILRLQKDISVNCKGEKPVNAREILLVIPQDYSIEHLMGGVVVVRGQFQASEDVNLKFPLQMKVLRMEALNASLQ